MRRYAVAPDHGRPSSDEPEASIGMSRTTHSMHGKTVLITGGTGGIDRAAAIGLLALIHPSAWKVNSQKFVCTEF
jgi:hypothetical protein